MKKVTSLLLLAGVAAFGLVGCGDDVTTQPTPPQVQSVTVSPSSVTIEVGESVKLAANVQADEGASTAVTWASSNSSVASVDGSGNVTGQSTGTATITATSNADNSKSGAAEVTVTEAGGDRPSLNIKGINCLNENLCNESSTYGGDLRIELNYDEGDQDIAAVQLLLNGEVVREQTFSTNQVSGLSRATEGTTDVVFDLQTDAAGECTMGEQLTPNLPNGTYELSARLMLESGDPETATWDDSLNLNNPNRIEVVHVDGTGATGVGGGSANHSQAPEGQRFWSENYTLDEGADGRVLTFAACPVIFDDGLTVGEIRLAGTTSDGIAPNDDVSLDSLANGALSSDDAEPFDYMAFFGTNDGVEDTNGGHTIGSKGNSDIRIFNDEGEDVTSEFTVNALSDFWLDFTAPREATFEGALARIQIDGEDIFVEPPRHYSDETADYVLPDGTVMADGDPDGDGVASDYNITDVIDDGIGVDYDAQPTDVFEDTTPPTGTPVAEDVDGLNDGCPDDCVLAEEGPGTDPDDPSWYYAQVPELTDLILNSRTTENVGELFASDDHGLDRGEPDVTAVDTIPDGAIIDDDGMGVIFDAVDPDLVNDADPADPGSAVNDSLCGTTCAWIFATANDTIGLDVDDNGTDKSSDPDFHIDLTGMQQGANELMASVPDSAVFGPNVGTFTWSFVYDTIPPTVGFSGVTGLNQSDADFVEFTVSGSVTDRNGDGSAVQSAVLTVTFADGDDVCGTGDDTAATGVDPMVDTVTAQVQSNGGDYEVDFTAANTGNPQDTVRYCFNMSADDGAVHPDGTDANHETTKSAGKDFIWNP